VAGVTELTGKTVLITGASRGIGAAIAAAMAAAGARLALNSRGEESLRATADSIDGETLVLPGDVTDADVARGVVRDAVAGLGRIDVIVNNVGGSSFMVPFTDLRFSGWEKLVRLNVYSAVHVTQAAVGAMLERGSGSIINVASVAGLGGTPGLIPYGASKAALISLTRSLALEFASRGVRVNALCPGWTATDLNRNLWEDEAASAALTATIPMGRWGRAEEMAGPAVFLASDASSFMTGQTLVVDGGQSAS
jgi:NAD(P)-dependent dehydrogenase (short-subunit alcohol dehydrogenase family)